MLLKKAAFVFYIIRSEAINKRVNQKIVNSQTPKPMTVIIQETFPTLSRISLAVEVVRSKESTISPIKKTKEGKPNPEIIAVIKPTNIKI